MYFVSSILRAPCLGCAAFALCPGHLQGIWDGAALYRKKEGKHFEKRRKEAAQFVFLLLHHDQLPPTPSSCQKAAQFF